MEKPVISISKLVVADGEYIGTWRGNRVKIKPSFTYSFEVNCFSGTMTELPVLVKIIDGVASIEEIKK